ncbi:MAG TPA: N-acetylglucosamine-6-phosphate deacetylase [Ilumatobacteraceae bacterium]|jgi:N-acetylglucosamine-6-phosphate deacetylase
MTTLVVAGGTVCADGEWMEADVIVDALRITAVEPPEGQRLASTVDATNCFVVPGFVDLQLNGAVGVDLTTQPERIGEVAAFLVQCGVTSFMPTVISSSAGEIAHAIAVMRDWSHDTEPAARSLGIHLEGPFLNPAKAGAHPLLHLRPPSLLEAGGWTIETGVAMVTIAPELPKALDVIELLTANGVTVCAGHTEATPADIDAAIASGIRGVTHLFNAMGPLNARVPGPAGAALSDTGLIAGLIVDGIHVDRAMVRLAWRALGPHRVALVTDAITALGCPNGAFSIGDTQVVVDDSGARNADGVLAGSVLRFDQAVRNLMAFTGCDLAEASISASTTPARLAQRHDIGRLVAGYAADIVVLDANREVVVTIVDGRVVFDPQGRFDEHDGGPMWKS